MPRSAVASTARSAKAPVSSKRALQLYKDPIDALAARREARINALLEQLTRSQRKVVAEIAQRARDGGMHDVLVELQEGQDLDGLRLVQRGVPLPVQHFERMYYDFICRVAGDPWPDERVGKRRRRKLAR